MSDLPKPVWSGSFYVLGVEVKCHVLDNGQRIIEADSVAELLAAMAKPNIGDEEAGDIDAFARWQRGYD